MLRWLICAIPPAAALVVWLSPLAFVPVPWPDDSAFYFVAKELFKWPPRWVMLPQAPFEPTYAQFNFNTMPLYPILIGLGRFIGIDGSFALKLWPLAAWGFSGALLVAYLLRAGLPAIGATLVALTFSLDPELRWASVIVRPESLIGLCGMALVLGITFGFPKRLRTRGLWDPVAFLLAIAAYAHFNAIHLVLPAALIAVSRKIDWRRLFGIGWRTVLYLSPWLLVALVKHELFLHQMQTQWARLAVTNHWLDSPTSALGSLFQAMGNPDPWPRDLLLASGTLLWILIFAAVIAGFALPAWRAFRHLEPPAINLTPAAGWVLSSIWLWHSKPEVWFVYYIHAAIVCFAGIAALAAWQSRKRLIYATSLGLLLTALTAMFATIDVSEATNMSSKGYWNWKTYDHFVDCIDRRLSHLESELGHTRFRVWCPTWPDVTIELSRRHPNWELSRTNDFWDRAPLAVQHGRDVEAVVVTETINRAEAEIDAPQSEYPHVASVWMTWKAHFLNKLWTKPGWKPNRHLCQSGRWQAFIFMQEPSK